MGDPSSNSTDSISSSESRNSDHTNLIMLKPGKEPPRADPACFVSGVPKPESTGSTVRSTTTTSGVPPQWTSSSTRGPTQQMHPVHKDHQLTSTTSVNSISSLPIAVTAANHTSSISSVAFRLSSSKQNTFAMSIGPKTPSISVSLTTKKKKKRSDTNRNASAGRWTEQEHQAFLNGLSLYGREWKKVAEHIPTRTSAQVRSHAQKYFAKIQKEQELMSNVVYGNNGSSAHAILDKGEEDDNSEVQEQVQLSASVQANVARILAEPQTVQREVEETLQRLRARYRELQRRLRERGGISGGDDTSSRASLESLQNEELIALHVLQGGLPHRDNSSSAGENHDDDEDEELEEEEDKESRIKRRRLG